MIEQKEGAEALGELIDAHIKQSGIVASKVDDGHVIVFTTATLEKLLEASRAEGKVIVFVKHGASA